MGCARFKTVRLGDPGPAFNGRTVPIARESRKLTREECAQRLGWPVNHLRAIEEGAEQPTAGEIAQLSLVLNFPKPFFWKTGPLPGGEGWMCGEGVVPCHFCGYVADYLCDYPVGEGKTCDLPLCDAHRIRQGGELQEIDFCPTHSIIARGLVAVPPQQEGS